jgi:glycosyltransferase involved in cell wall biosynthesis
LKKKAEGVEGGEPIFDRAKLAEEYRGADLFVYPSLAESGEAMPLGPVEAMGCGAVPVVSDLKVFGEYLVPGKNGWTFNHRERGAENLAAVLANALSADLTKMREEARRTAGNFSPARIAELHLEFFQAVGKNSD